VTFEIGSFAFLSLDQTAKRSDFRFPGRLAPAGPQNETTNQEMLNADEPALKFRLFTVADAVSV
jgi:hypothetical protein